MNKENKTQIIWKNLKGFEDKYKISSKGEIINKKDNKKINTRISKDGYIRVTLYYKNKSYIKSIHRLVAETFIEKKTTTSNLEVNHIDGNKLNNNINNLEWITHKENIEHAWKKNLFESVRKASKRYGKDNPNAKRVYQIKDKKVVEVFDTIKEAAIKTKTNKTSIGKCCNKKRNKANGFEWSFESPPYAIKKVAYGKTVSGHSKNRNRNYITPLLQGDDEMTKTETSDLKELRNIFKKTKNNKSKLALSLLDKAEFMNETLKKLEYKVKTEGVVTTMCQGAYDIERENPALKSYNTTIKNYASVVKQIVDLLPENENKQAGEDLLKFIASGKK